MIKIVCIYGCIFFDLTDVRIDLGLFTETSAHGLIKK